MKRMIAAALLMSSPAFADDRHPNVYNFQASTDGNSPRGSLIADSQGNMYGTAAFGGAANGGNVFAFVPPADGVSLGQLTTLYSFTGGADGSLPSAGLVADSQGNLYGTTMQDGNSLGGTVFELSPPAAGQTAWTETTLWGFGAGSDGRNPVGSLTLGPDGSLYGTTNWGGANNHGTVFRLSPAGAGAPWSETILWSFSGSGDGAQPIAGLLLDQQGRLYGTTTLGGSAGEGTVFQLTPSQDGTPASLATLWSFSGGTDGSEPGSDLTLGSDGSLYGTATFGGSSKSTCWQSAFPFYGVPLSWSQYANAAPYVPAGGSECGTVYRLIPPASGKTDWKLRTLYEFQGSPDGGNPLGGAALLPNGNLIGYTVNLGHKFYGTTYELTPALNPTREWKLDTPASFNADSDGIYALGTPILGVAGRIYATMMQGGNTWTHKDLHGYGVIFSVQP